jgi:putative copper export protein
MLPLSLLTRILLREEGLFFVALLCQMGVSVMTVAIESERETSHLSYGELLTIGSIAFLRKMRYHVTDTHL